MSGLAHLLSPVRIGAMVLPNRCVMPPMGTNLNNRDATVSEANVAYIKRQAQSGVALVISEIAGVHPTGTLGIGAYDDRFIPGLKHYADAVHEAGARVAMQLHHAGREAFYQLKKGTAMGPSAIPSLIYGMAPREMTKDDIAMVIEAFGQAAVRAQHAGFDAVEIHGAHGYLLTQFLSAISNQRRDEYGGSFRNRARFMIEVIKEVRMRVGLNFPILLRVSAEEYIKNGYTVEDLQTILAELVSAG
jgi:2,4-dienoyl-CoA reductase-like NADH-dependent reductase (Old Yellow Enzyme family)